MSHVESDSKNKIPGKLVSRILGMRGEGTEDLWVSGMTVTEAMEIIGGEITEEKGLRGELLLHIKRKLHDPLNILRRSDREIKEKMFAGFLREVRHTIPPNLKKS